MPSEDENCTLVEVTEEEVENSVKHIPSLATVVRRAEPLTENRDSLRRAGEDGPGHRRAAKKQTLGLRVWGWPGLSLTHSHQALGPGHISGQEAPASCSFSSVYSQILCDCREG